MTFQLSSTLILFIITLAPPLSPPLHAYQLNKVANFHFDQHTDEACMNTGQSVHLKYLRSKISLMAEKSIVRDGINGFVSFYFALKFLGIVHFPNSSKCLLDHPIQFSFEFNPFDRYAQCSLELSSLLLLLLLLLVMMMMIFFTHSVCIHNTK